MSPGFYEALLCTPLRRFHIKMGVLLSGTIVTRVARATRADHERSEKGRAKQLG